MNKLSPFTLRIGSFLLIVAHLAFDSPQDMHNGFYAKFDWKMGNFLADKIIA